MKLNKIFCIITILSVLGLSSCNQLFVSFLDEDNSTEQTLQTDGVEQNVQLSLTLPNDLKIESSDTNSRSVGASFSGLTYKVSATSSGQTTVTAESSSQEIGLVLATGHSWTITVNALNGSSIVLQGTKTIDVTGVLAETIPLSVYTGSGASVGSIDLYLSVATSIGLKSIK